MPFMRQWAQMVESCGLRTNKKGKGDEMRYTRKSAIEWTIRHWTWVAEKKGRHKSDWPELPERTIYADCFLCAYDIQRIHANHKDFFEDACVYCPYFKEFGHCYEEGESPYYQWTLKHNLRDARDFLEQLKTL